MFTREEIEEIVQYCNEHGVTYKSRLKEIGITEWQFMKANADTPRIRPASEKQESFSSWYVAMTVSGTDVDKQENRQMQKVRTRVRSDAMSIEVRTQTETVLRIQGNLDATMAQQ